MYICIRFFAHACTFGPFFYFLKKYRDKVNESFYVDHLTLCENIELCAAKTGNKSLEAFELIQYNQ